MLNSILSTGIVPRTMHLAGHLATALEVDDRLLLAVIETMGWQRRDEQRAQALAHETAYLADSDRICAPQPLEPDPNLCLLRHCTGSRGFGMCPCPITRGS